MYYKDLGDLLRQKMAEKKFSTYDVARESGGRINANTITRIMNGDIGEAKLSTLEAIAIAFDMSIEDVTLAARGIERRPQRFEIYADRFDAHDLSDSEWQLLEVYFNDHVKAWKKFQQDRLAGKFVSDPNEKKKK